jgi:pantothenate kinase
MKHNIGDIVMTSKVCGEERIAAITNIIRSRHDNKICYYITICGSPQLGSILITECEIVENLTKRKENEI